MKFKLIIILAMSSLIFASFLSVHAVPTSPAEDSLKTVKDRGYLMVGTDATYPPFEELDGTTFKGFDVDIANQIALDLGVKLQFVNIAWDFIIPDLKLSKYDCIISAMTITPEREIEVDFTRWYYKSTQSVLVTTANPYNITSVDELNKTVIRIGFQSGTTSNYYADDNLQNATVTSYDTILLAITDLKNGNLDVVLGDKAVLMNAAAGGGVKVVDDFSPEDFGIAVKSGATTLLAAINSSICDLLGSDPSNPVPTDLYNIIYFKWFGVSCTDIGYAGTVTAGAIPTATLYVAAPGFEVITIICIGVTLPILRKLRK